jgi:putative heme transporter
VLALGEIVAQSQPMASASQQGADKLNQMAGGTLGAVVSVVQALTTSGLETIRSVISELGTGIIVALLSALLCFYFMRDGDRLWGLGVGRIPGRHKDDVRATGLRAFEVLGGYMYGTAAISFVGAASQFVIMLLLGVPLALPVFVLSFFLCFIPYIGGFLSTGIALMLTIGTGSDSAIIVMVIWTLVFNIVTGNIVSPIVYGKTVSLHPAIVLIAIPIGSTVAGMLGMLLVVPVLGVIAVSWRTVIRLMSNDPASGGGAEAPDPLPDDSPAPAAAELVPAGTA